MHHLFMKQITCPVHLPHSLSIYLHFNSHFSRWSWVSRYSISPFWILQELRMMEVVITGAIRRAKLQSNRHHQQSNTQCFYRPDALCVAQPSVKSPELKIH